MVLFSIAPELNSYTTERTRQLFERMEDEIAAVPGVTSVVAAIVPVLAGDNWGNSLGGRRLRGGSGHQHQRVVQRRRPRLLQDDGHPADGGPRVHARRRVRHAEGRDRQPGVREEVQSRRQPARQALRPRRRHRHASSTSRSSASRRTRNTATSRTHRRRSTSCRIGRKSVSATRTSTFAPPRRPSRCCRRFPRVMRKLDASLPLDDVKTMETQIRENVVAGSHHQHAVARVCGAGDGAGGDRPLRRAGLYRRAADARVRPPHGAWRRRRRGARHGDEAGRADGDRRRRDRHGDRHRCRPAGEVVAVRNGRPTIRSCWRPRQSRWRSSRSAPDSCRPCARRRSIR